MLGKWDFWKIRFWELEFWEIIILGIWNFGKLKSWNIKILENGIFGESVIWKNGILGKLDNWIQFITFV